MKVINIEKNSSLEFENFETVEDCIEDIKFNFIDGLYDEFTFIYEEGKYKCKHFHFEGSGTTLAESLFNLIEVIRIETIK